MENKIESTKIVEIIKEYKSATNQDLKLSMDFIQKDFELTKETVIKLQKGRTIGRTMLKDNEQNVERGINYLR